MTDLIDPKEFTLGNRVYRLSKVPAVQAREIVAKYPLSAMPKLGEYAVNEATMLKLLSYVAAQTENGDWIKLTTIAVINNHVASWEDLVRLEWAMLEYNISFFQNGRILDLLDGFASSIPQWISKILTPSLEQLLQKEKPPTTN